MSQSICFSKSGVYDVMVGNDPGGVEREVYLLARELASRGHEVYVITGKKGQSIPDSKDEIHLIEGPEAASDSLSKVGKALSYYRSLKRADADIYICLGDILLASIYYSYCIFNDAKFVYRVTNDGKITSDDKDYRTYSKLTQRIYIESIRRADIVTTQTESQKQLLRDEYGISSQVIPGGYPLPASHEIREPNERKHFLWVGRLSNIKQPMVFVRIAEQLPHIKFIMVGPPEKGYTDEMNRNTDRLDNFTYKNFVPRDELLSLYQEAIALVNTAKVEGFPNTFLEAWSYGTPVISLHHTIDGLLTNEICGIYSEGSQDKLINDVQRLYESTKLHSQLSSSARLQMEKKFSLQAVVSMYEELFDYRRN